MTRASSGIVTSVRDLVRRAFSRVNEPPVPDVAELRRQHDEELRASGLSRLQIEELHRSATTGPEFERAIAEADAAFEEWKHTKEASELPNLGKPESSRDH